MHSKPTIVMHTTPAVHAYGVLGVAPFLVGAVGPWVMPEYTTFLTTAFQVYAAVIIAFLAGSIWATSLLSQVAGLQTHLVLAMFVVIVAWVCMALSDLATVPIHGACLLLLCWWEKQTNLRDVLSVDYLQLRSRLTWSVVACHMLVVFNLLRENQLT